MTRLKILATAVVAAAMLAGCGGGGGGSGPATETGGDPAPAAYQVSAGDRLTFSTDNSLFGSGSAPGTLNGVPGTFTCASVCELKTISDSGSEVYTVREAVGVTFTPDSARTGTGSEQPQETVAATMAAERLAKILPRTDSLVMSTAYVEAEGYPPAFSSSCSGATCVFRNPLSGISVSVGLDDLDLDTSGTAPLLTKYGITIIEDNDGRLASVMDHSAFRVESFGDRELLDVPVWLRVSTAGGDLTRSRPGGTATWTGLMVGVPFDPGTASRADLLQGDAALTYDFSGSSLDASFTGIRNVARNRAHSVTSVRFDDIPVSSNGTFGSGQTGNRIQGGFYGPGHAETVGVFEKRGIVGSFGGKR